MLTFEIANKKILIETPVDPKDYLKSVDDVVEKYSSDYKIPFWIDVWPSAIALAEFILESDEFTGKKVLELGCGLGLTTVALGFKNAIITATDYEMMALQYARRNYLKNLGNETNARFVYLDWRCPRLSEKFDFVIGSDIIYERDLFPNIVNVLKIAMNPDSICYLADPNRIFTQEFFKILTVESFDSEIVSRREVFYRDMKANVSIYRIKKSQTDR